VQELPESEKQALPVDGNVLELDEYSVEMLEATETIE